MARPRKFDEGEVLQAAAEVFLAKGYEATSTRDLAACTGLTPSSIYAAFGDKRGLFLRALDGYLERNQRDRIAHLEATLSPAEAIAGYFAISVERLLADGQHRGCMLVNAALEATSSDPDMKRLVAEETAVTEGFFRRNVAAAQQTGDIARTHSADDVAKMLLSVVLGLRVLARIRPEPDLLTGAARTALAQVGLSLPPVPGGAA